MTFIKGVFAFGGVALLAACGTEMPDADDEVSIAIVCSAELLDSAGAVVASIEDTVNVAAPRDTVGTDPRPCRSSFSMATRSLTLNAKSASDTATGDPRD